MTRVSSHGHNGILGYDIIRDNDNTTWRIQYLSAPVEWMYKIRKINSLEYKRHILVPKNLAMKLFEKKNITPTEDWFSQGASPKWKIGFVLGYLLPRYRDSSYVEDSWEFKTGDSFTGPTICGNWTRNNCLVYGHFCIGQRQYNAYCFTFLNAGLCWSVSHMSMKEIASTGLALNWEKVEVLIIV